MKYAEFMKIVDKWSYNDIVCFLMEYDEQIELEEISSYANDKNIMEHTNLPEVEE